jgi:hypothetical protein
MFLNDWESISRHSSAEFQQIDSIRGLFSSLQANLPPASLDDRAKFDGDAVNACRNAGYTVLLTLGAVYESQASGNPGPGDFGEKLAETKAAETCDRIYERVGEPDQAFQIGRNQTASEFWLTKAFGVVPKDVVTLVGEINDTFKAIEPDPKKPPSTSMTRTEALKTFSSQLDTLDAKTAEISPELRDVTGMLVVEAARKPLKILRENQPDVGFNRGLAPEEFKKLAERAREHQESRRPDDPRDRE